jgi:hypothetical protein
VDVDVEVEVVLVEDVDVELELEELELLVVELHVTSLFPKLISAILNSVTVLCHDHPGGPRRTASI